MRQSAAPTARTLAGVALLAGGWLGAALLTLWAAGPALAAARAPGPADFDHLVLLSAVAGTALLLAWLGCCAACAGLAALPGTVGAMTRRISDRMTPALLRATVGGVLGLAVAAAPAMTAGAAAAASHPRAGLSVPLGAPPAAGGTGAAVRPVVPVLPTATVDRPGGAGWSPPPPATPARVTAGRGLHLVTTGGDSRTDDEGVVVRRGDSLWDLAARDLGPGADAAEIAAAWPRWYEANRTSIGADPDVIRPGTLLHRPAEVPAASRHARTTP